MNNLVLHLVSYIALVFFNYYVLKISSNWITVMLFTALYYIIGTVLAEFLFRT